MNLTERIEDLSTMGASRQKKEMHKLVLESRIEELQKALDTRLWNDGMGVYLTEGIDQLKKELEKL